MSPARDLGSATVSGIVTDVRWDDVAAIMRGQVLADDGEAHVLVSGRSGPVSADLLGDRVVVRGVVSRDVLGRPAFVVRGLRVVAEPEEEEWQETEWGMGPAVNDGDRNWDPEYLLRTLVDG